MTRFEAYFVHAANLLVGGTGLVYAWTRYWAESDDPLAIANHPLQPHALYSHVIAAPLLVFAAGIIWQRHVWTRLSRGQVERRGSGLALAVTLVPMISSGYLIQTAIDDGWRRVWIAVHLGASCLWLGGYVLHLISRRAPASRGIHASPAASSTRG